ncbi:hypothetical protein [Phenylobacterium sp.]|uniref:hypothetical protein n=1 Tax=Phenylobacterium sp. TaxID=1871053 RepID=UPI00391B166D
MRAFGTGAAGLALAAAVGGAATAQEASADAALDGLAACAAVVDPAQKAACYDAAYAALNGQVRSGEISIIRRKEAQAAQRGAFGLNLPSLQIFDKASGSQGPLESIADKVAKAYRNGEGRWVVETAEGQVWRQTDNETISPRPKPGDPVEIRKAALGSYMMKVGEARGVRAKRGE